MSLAWVATKLYWNLTAAVPLTQLPTVWDHYFPQIRRSGLADRRTTRDDDRFDLLLLGGSVLEPAWGTIEAEIQQRLERLAPGRARIYNLAEAGFTSRDSRVQYEHLSLDRFDLVLIYEGINDVRMNCCPPEEFQDDYSHVSRYGGMLKRLEAGTLSLPAAAMDRWRTVAQSLPLGTADPRLLDYAADPQTPAPCEPIWKRSPERPGRRGDPLLVLTYAWHIPENYSSERFRDGALDYSHESAHACGVEMWGRAEHVKQTLSLQNAAIRELAQSDPGLRFVDQAELLPGNAENFVDPCHRQPPAAGVLSTTSGPKSKAPPHFARLEMNPAELRHIDTRHVWHPFTPMQAYAREETPLISDSQGFELIDVEAATISMAFRRCGATSTVIGFPRSTPRFVGNSTASPIPLFWDWETFRPSNWPIDWSRSPRPGSTTSSIPTTVRPPSKWRSRSPCNTIASASDHPERRGVYVSLAGAYHGDTIGSVSVGGIDLFHGLYGQLCFTPWRPRSRRVAHAAGYVARRLSGLLRPHVRRDAAGPPRSSRRVRDGAARSGGRGNPRASSRVSAAGA